MSIETGKAVERVSYIDYIRAVGIVLMVLAHIPLSSAFVHYVHGFHMPLFFIVSGYCYKGGEGHLKKTIKKLLVPYFSFSAMAYLLWFVEMRPLSLLDALKPVTAIFWVNSEGMPLAGALWFLTAMLIVNIIVFSFSDFTLSRREKIDLIQIFTLT